MALAVVLPATAQTLAPAAPAHATAPPPAAAAVSPAEARNLLDLLHDPKRRAAFEATLQAMVKTQTAAEPKPATLAQGSVGAQVVAESGLWLAQLEGEVAAFGHLLGNLPGVWRFTQHTLENPASRARLINVGWRMAAVLGAAAVADLALAFALRRPVRRLGAREDDREPDERRRTRALRLMRRLPWAVLRLVLDMLPPAAFLAIGFGGMLLTTPPAQDLLRTAITAYLGWRLAVVLARVVFSPGLPALRLLHVSDEGAAYAVVWIARVFAVAAGGYALVAIGIDFGVPLPAAQAVLKAVALIDHLFLVIIVLQCRRSVAAWIRGPGHRDGITALMRRRIAAVWHLLAIFLIAGTWLVWAAEMRHGYARLGRLLLISLGVLAASRLASILLLGGLDRLFRVPPRTAAHYPGLEARANRYYPLLRRSLGAALVLATAVALLQAWGVDTIAWFQRSALGGRLAGALATIAIAGLVVLGIWELVNGALDRELARMTREAQMVRAARLRTLLPILRTLLVAALLAVFGLTALSEIGVNIAPLLAGAGILGVAIGFGSQKLVQDFITGIFLLLENAMQVGDWVTVAGLSGSVENLSIRTMRLRAGDGSVHIVPFSAVSTVTNVNRGIGNAAVTVNVPIEEDADRVSDTLAAIAKEMRAEARFGEMMRSDFQLWGVDRVDAGVQTIVGQIVCTDGGRWAVQREFNRRMAARFKGLGIPIATPTQTVLMRRAPEPAPSADLAPATPALPQSPPPAALGNTT